MTLRPPLCENRYDSSIHRFWTMLALFILAAKLHARHFFSMQSSLSSHVALVSGATSRICRSAATELARAGWDVVLTCRPYHIATCKNVTIASWKSEALHQKFWIEEVDLGNLTSMELFVERVNAKYGTRLRAVVNCASIAPSKYVLSADGMEMQFQVNVLAYHKMMHGLVGSLRSNRPSSIVNVVSGSLDNTHHSAGVSLNALLAISNQSYNALLQYSYTKLAEQMLTWGAARRYSDIFINSITPGETSLEDSKLSQDALYAFPNFREQREKYCKLCWSPLAAGKEITQLALEALNNHFTGTSTLALPGERTRRNLSPSINVSQAEQLWAFCDAVLRSQWLANGRNYVAAMPEA